MFVSNQQFLKTFIENSGRLYEFGVFVVFDDIDKGSDSFFPGEVDYFTRSHSAGSSHRGYKSSVDSDLVQETDSDLESCSCGSFLPLVPGDYIRVSLQLLNSRHQLLLALCYWQVILLVNNFLPVSRVHR